MSRAAVALARTGLEVLVGPSRRSHLFLAGVGCLAPTITIGGQGGHMERSAFMSAVFIAFLPGEAVLRAPRDPSRAALSANPLPALPVRPYDRAVARVLLALLTLVPGLSIMLVRTGPTPVPAQAATLAGSVALIALWNAFAERRLTNARHRVATPLVGLAVVAGFVLGVAYSSPLAALGAAGVALALTRAEDAIARRLGMQSPNAATLLGYRAHARLDGEGPLGAPPLGPDLALADLGRRDAVRLGLRDGVLFGLLVLALSAMMPVAMGSAPMGDLEEAAALLRNLAADPKTLGIPMTLLAGLTSLSGIRSTVLPGHSAHPDQRANALAPLRWLPVSHADVWRQTARTTVRAWWALGMGTLLPALPLLLWHPDYVAQRILLLWAGALILGSGLALVAQARGPLQALAKGVLRPSALSLLPNYLAVLPLVTVGPALLAFGGTPGQVGLPSVGLFAYEVLVAVTAFAWFASKSPAQGSPSQRASSR